jgi:hypothetical protein
MKPGDSRRYVSGSTDLFQVEKRFWKDHVLDNSGVQSRRRQCFLHDMVVQNQPCWSDVVCRAMRLISSILRSDAPCRLSNTLVHLRLMVLVH